MIFMIKRIMRKILVITFWFCLFQNCFSQLNWTNVDSLYQPLPSSVHVYFTDQPIDTGVFRSYYLIADVKDMELDFTTDTTYKRRLTPAQFYQKNNKPLVVVNGTFFSFQTNQNLNTVIKDGKLVSYNASVKGRGRDSVNRYQAFKSAIGITKDRKIDIAWLYTDSSKKYPIAFQLPLCEEDILLNSKLKLKFSKAKKFGGCVTDLVMKNYVDKKWKMQTAIGGGPSLLQYDYIKITNEEERMFTGKAINDKHPRTAMGYTKDRKLIILVIQGRSESGGGASLPQEAQILKDLGCVEALNLDGGGSSCMLVNGKETIKPSDKEGQRPVPAVFIIKQK
jgi:exopolysaccharide biosynthesis protein